MKLFANLIASVTVVMVGLSSGQAEEILALGTSNTNCKGVDRALSFTVKLDEFLRADGLKVRAINGWGRWRQAILDD